MAPPDIIKISFAVDRSIAMNGSTERQSPMIFRILTSKRIGVDVNDARPSAATECVYLAEPVRSQSTHDNLPI
jgi:hypothetical protein